MLRGGVSKPEVSTLSQSQSLSNAADISNRNMIISGTFSYIDRLFPLFDDIFKYSKIPEVFYSILILLNTIQMISTSFWPGIESIHDYDGIPGKIVKVLVQIAYFNDLSYSDTMFTIGFIILTVLFVIVLGVIGIQLLIYNQKRRFIKWTLYPTRIIVEFIPLILICPIGLYIGQLFTQITRGFKTMHVVFFVLGILYACFVVFIHFVVSFLLSSSPYLSPAPTSCWSGSFYFILTINYGAWPLLAEIFQIFDSYYSNILIALKLAVSAYMFFELTSLPVVHVDINAVVFTVMVCFTGLDILTFIKLCGVDIDYLVFLIVGVVLFLLSAVGSKIFISKYRIILKKRLSYQALDKFCEENEVQETIDQDITNQNQPKSKVAVYCNDNRKREYFRHFKIDVSESKAELYLRVGLAEHADLFIDWSLVKYIAEYYPSPHMLATLTQFISYFPGESRLLNFFFVQVVVINNLKFYHRFLLFEIHRVKGLRQSSASTEINDKVMELKRITQAAIKTSQDFWKTIPSQNIGMFYSIRSQTKHIQAYYEEAIDKWPNNVRLSEDYSKFLIECATDFTTGVKVRHRADLVEQGKNFTVDVSFRSLIRAYPMYLKRNIVDVKGNFIYMKTSQSRGSLSSSSQHNSQMSTGTIDGELDIEIEEQVAKISFSHHRMRLAYQRSLEDRKSAASMRLKAAALWTLVFATAVLVFCFGYLYNIFNDRASNVSTQFTLNKVRYGYDAAFGDIIIEWIRRSGGIKDDLWEDLTSSDGTSVYGLALMNGALNDSTRWNNFGSGYLTHFMNSVMEWASNGIDVHNIVSAMVNDDLTLSTCFGDEIIYSTQNCTLNEALSYLFMNMRIVAMENQSENWHNSSEWCESVINIPSMKVVFENMQTSMSNDQTSLQEQTEKNIYTILIPICCCFVVLTLPFLIIFLTNVFNELKQLLKLMDSVDDDSKNEAAKYFKDELQNDDQGECLSSHSKNRISETFFYVSIFIPIVLLVAVFLGVVFLTLDQNSTFLSLALWMTLGCSRTNLMLESAAYTALALALNKHIETGFLTVPDAIAGSQGLYTNLNDYNNELLRGSETLAPCVGEDAEFDSINFEDTCDTNGNASDVHSTYKCFALDRAISFLLELGDKIFTNIDTEDFTIDSNIYHVIHIVNSHMVDKSYRAAEILETFSSDSISSFRGYLAALCFGGIALNIIGFAVFWSELLRLDVAYQGAIQLLRRLSPPSVIQNVNLLNYLLNRKNEKSSNKMTTSMLIIHNSKDSVFCLNKNESIEVVNQAVSGLFGYTPEQLLGQSISTVLPEKGSESIFNHFNLMRQGQCAMTFEAHTEGVTDGDQTIPMHVTIIGICDNNSTQAKSFAVIFRDETLLQKQRQAAEEAKANSEKLLYQILPRDIVTRLNAHETDISFSVPSATIVFVDIVKFSDYSSTLTPTQIMENLSAIFARFDSICSNFPLITKIKLIGDVYMAAAGLFTPEESPTNHASQVVQFGLDVLVALEELNGQLDSSLQVRIGVNTDGPLIAGVLGKDKPLFDIIGDPINVASRLQSTCIPGTVQISQTTYDAIRELSFNIEQRGEIVLKGKGKKMAYIVRGFPTGSMFMYSEPGIGEEQTVSPQ